MTAKSILKFGSGIRRPVFLSVADVIDAEEVREPRGRPAVLCPRPPLSSWRQQASAYRSRIPATVALPAHRAPLSHRAWRSAETGSRGRLKVR
jgi:hypothetical protein